MNYMTRTTFKTWTAAAFLLGVGALVGLSLSSSTTQAQVVFGQTEKDAIVNEAIVNAERIIFEETVRRSIFDAYINGENLDSIQNNLQYINASYSPNATFDVSALSTTTNRTIATLDVDSTTAVGVRTRALIELLNKRDNYLVNRITELQTDLQAIKDSTGGTANIRNAINGSYLPTQTRTKADAVQDYKDDINAGNQDI